MTPTFGHPTERDEKRATEARPVAATEARPVAADETRPTAAGETPAAVRRRTVLRGAVAAGAAAGAAAAGLAPGATGRAGAAAASAEPPVVTADGPPLLCEPYLLDPFPHGVRVAWCTESQGSRQVVVVGEAVPAMTDPQIIAAATGASDCDGTPGTVRWRRYVAGSRRLDRMREDAASKVPDRTYAQVEERAVWLHLAEVGGLPAGRRPYRVVSVDGAGKATLTPVYTLAPGLSAKDHARLLLTSDHQLKPMTAANLELAARTVGVELDGVLIAGDLVNVPDRASEWFDSIAGPGVAFFAGMTGRASKTIGGRTYRGAPFCQHTPIFPSIGNHEVMGRWSTTAPLKTQFDDPQPTEVAARRWNQTQPAGADRDTWISQHSWNTTSYEQLFPYPRSGEGGPRWYARSIGDVFVVNLFAASIWRSFNTTGKGKFQEAAASLGDPDSWGFGEFIFEPIKRGSRQFAWLERTLRSKPARAARYRVVMFHRPSHGLGWNSIPSYTDPVQAMTFDPTTGATTSVTYSYPLADDHVLRDVEPLLNECGVNLVLNGHSHVWNRFRNAAGVHWLETSNVGDTLGAFDVTSGQSRQMPALPDLVAQGDPGNLAPVVPTIAPLTSSAGDPLPYVASNEITVFSILDSGLGTVRSYRFDTRTPEVDPLLFDEFGLA